VASAEQQNPDDGSVGAELTRLIDGRDPKSRWLLVVIFISAIAARFLLPRLGWNPGGLQLQLVLAGVWLVVLIVIAAYQSSNRTGGE
jgi:hypothetical protein